MPISPTLTLTVDKTVASPGENVTLSGSLDIPKEDGDVRKDNIIDIYDVVRFAKSFGKRQGEPGYDPDADLNKDGVVDIYDALKIAAAFGQTSGGKPIALYVSSDGVNWTPITQVTTSPSGTIGSFNYTDTIPKDTPTPSVRYYMAYFQGGVY
jgi:hypothetical protein